MNKKFALAAFPAKPETKTPGAGPVKVTVPQSDPLTPATANVLDRGLVGA